MAGLILGWTLGLGLPALALHMVTVALSRALRTYSRSLLEEVCQANGHPDRADAIAHLDEPTERGAEALAALTGPQDAVEEMRRSYQERRQLVVEGLRRIPGLELEPPGGSFYAFPRVEGVMARLGLATSAELARLILERAHVAVVPGSAFGSEGFLRLSFAAAPPALEEALRRLGRVLA